jgi:excisionase family DNA binding protein
MRPQKTQASAQYSSAYIRNRRQNPLEAGSGGQHMALVSVSRAASALGVGDDTVRRWVKAGRLPSSEDPLGRLLVEVPDDAIAATETEAGPAEVAALRQRLATAEQRLAAVGAQRDALERERDVLEREREMLAAELNARRVELGVAADRERELLRALHQAQQLHAQAAGRLPFGGADDPGAGPGASAEGMLTPAATGTFRRGPLQRCRRCGLESRIQDLFVEGLCRDCREEIASPVGEASSD